MTLQILDIVDGNKFDAAREKATGTDGVIIKAGQGRLEYVWDKYALQCNDAGLPWGLYWLCDARYSPESHKAAIKAAFPTGYFGKLGLFLDVEKPTMWMLDWMYRAQPYAYYKPIESIWRGVQAYAGVYPGWYTSAGAWDLICPGMPLSLQKEIGAKCPLWIANYGVSTPKMRGQWPKWSMWQYQEGPDYSVADEDWYESMVGAIEPPAPEGEELKAVSVTVRSDRAELVNVFADEQDVTAITTFHVQPFPVTPPPPPAPTNLYRILRDQEMPASYWGGQSRTAAEDWQGNPITPATVKLHGPDPVTQFPEAAVKKVHELNDPYGTFTYVTRESAGWSNRGQEWPEKMEPIAFEGNVLEVTHIEGARAYVKTDITVIHSWQNIDQAGNLMGAQNPAATGDGWIVLAYPGEYWIELDKLAKL